MRSAHSGIRMDRLGRASLAGALIAALASCGTAPPGPAAGGTGSATPLETTTSTTSSPTPTTTTTTPAPVSVVVPSEVLKTALVTKVLAKTYGVDLEDSGDYSVPGGLVMASEGEYVSGDRGCAALLNSHSVEAEAFAYVSLSNKTAGLEELVESYPTVPAAQKVSAENLAQAKTCRTFVLTDPDTGERVQYKHTVTATRSGDVDRVLHHFNGLTKKYTYEFHMLEVRMGGEMMHLTWGGVAKDPSSAAWAQFQKVINAYRAEHPRNGSAALVSN